MAKAPGYFSIVDNPEESLPYLLRLLKHKRNRDLFVDLADVRVITPDAIAMLIAIVRPLGQNSRVDVSGNYPEEAAAFAAIRESGFNEYIATSVSASADKKGAIVRQDVSIDSKRANGASARRLIDFAAGNDAEKRRRLKPVYANLVECMGNTFQHAGKVQGEKTWWASVFRDTARGCDCFTFVDMGMGIFNSVELTARLKVFNLIGLLRPRILKDLLLGLIPSSTGKAYRGRGLPSIYKSAKAGKLTRLVVVTNDVYGDALRDDFRTIPEALQGVLLYWEVPQ